MSSPTPPRLSGTHSHQALVPITPSLLSRLLATAPWLKASPQASSDLTAQHSGRHDRSVLLPVLVQVCRTPQSPQSSLSSVPTGFRPASQLLTLGSQQGTGLEPRFVATCLLHVGAPFAPTAPNADFFRGRPRGRPQAPPPSIRAPVQRSAQCFHLGFSRTLQIELLVFLPNPLLPPSSRLEVNGRSVLSAGPTKTWALPWTQLCQTCHGMFLQNPLARASERIKEEAGPSSLHALPPRPRSLSAERPFKS